MRVPALCNNSHFFIFAKKENKMPDFAHIANIVQTVGWYVGSHLGMMRLSNLCEYVATVVLR
jgi:hypothetical protein